MQENINQISSFSALKVGDFAKVAGFFKGNLSYRKKLLAMGVTPNTTFKVVRVAPLGDPIEIKIRGYMLSLRKSEASLISIVKAS